jgi:hypothetical protein
LSALAAALCTFAAWVRVEEALASGFVLDLDAEAGPSRTVRALDLDAAQARRLSPVLPARARWTTWLVLEDDAAYTLLVTARAPSRVRVDGRLALEHDGRPRRLTREIPLTSGAHEVVVEQDVGARDPELRVALLRPGEEPRRLETMSVYAGPPRAFEPGLRRAARWAGALGLILAAIIAVALGRRFKGWPAATRARRLRQAAHGAALLLTVYAAALRVHALAAKYEETAPAWMARAVPVIRLLHPRGMRWVPPENPYDGDPFSYLRCAREMRHFYGASVREPVFVFATKLALHTTGGRDIAVNLASSAFSTLLVPATYALGVAAFSPPVALIAAAGIAVEREAIALGVEGWRDDAFAMWVALSAMALLRLRNRPTRAASVLAGVIFAGACLTRITSLSFLVPGLLFAAVGGADERRPRLRATVVAAAVAGVLVAPFLIACWVEYGDPLHAINAHTRFYRSRSTGVDQTETSVVAMLGEGRGPFALVDTAVVGLTSYPFANKWQYFDYWADWLGPVLAAFAIVGLLLWTLEPRGRLLLVLLFSSLLPYAFTWDIPGGSEWRFTLHAYAFYLLAAASAPSLVASTLRRLGQTSPKRAAAAVGAVVLVGMLGYAAGCGLAYLHVREDVAAGRGALVAAGLRDGLFFSDGWSSLVRIGNVVVRRGSPAGAAIRLPLHASTAYRLVLRADPGSDQATRLEAALNDVPLGTIELTRNPRRIGGGELAIPREVPRDGPNTLTLRSSGNAPFDLWLVRLEPTGR